MNRSSQHPLRELAERTRHAGAVLRTRSLETRARVLYEALWALADKKAPSGRHAREALARTTGLSPEMIDWSLAALPIEQARLLMFAERAEDRVPVDLAGVVLAGNVFVAAIEPITAALLLGAPIVVKASSRDDAMPRLFRAAIREQDPELAEALAVVTFPGGDEDKERALFSRAESVVGYGSDHALSELATRLAPGARFFAHGHGVGVAFVVPPDHDADVTTITDALAIDVCAYDQRGCMSPHVVFVEPTEHVSARDFAIQLARAMDRLGQRVPRGPLPPKVASQQLQWRAIGEAQGGLFEGDGFAVALSSGFRLSPGYRNVVVVECTRDRFASAIDSVSRFVRVLAQNGQWVTAPADCRCCAMGEMQRPRFGETRDGIPLHVAFLKET